MSNFYIFHGNVNKTFLKWSINKYLKATTFQYSYLEIGPV